MKKVLFLIGVLVSFVACSNDDSSEIGNVSHNDFDFIGKLHNDGLRHVFGANSLPITRAEVDDYEVELEESALETSLEDYLKQQLEEDSRLSISEYCTVDVEQEIADAMTDANERMRTSTSLAFSDTPSDVLSMIDDVDVCDAAKDDLGDIYQSFSQYTGVSLFDYLTNKENAIAISNYNTLEKAILLSTISVGKNSLDYWNDITLTSGMSRRNVAKADMVGAVRGVWRGRHVIMVCSMLGGWMGGCSAALRHMLVQAVIDSAVYAFIESNEVKVDDKVLPPFPLKGDD